MMLEKTQRLLAELIAATLPALVTANRVFYPGDRPDPNALSLDGNSLAWVIVGRPRPFQGALVSSLVCVIDVCAKDVKTARVTADLILEKLIFNPRKPGVFSNPRAEPITEAGFERYNIVFTCTVNPS